MRIPVQLPLPGVAPAPVYACVTIAACPDGSVTIGWSARELVTLEQLLLGALPPSTRQDAPAEARDVLSALMEAVASLLDWPPFPD